MERMYNVIKENANNNISYADKNWAYQIKKLLGELGLMNLWKNQDTYNITFETINRRILCIFRQSWYSHINNSSRLSTYSLYKHEFEFEDYLKHVNKFRHVLTKFSLSAHNLNIETGRHNGIDRIQRKCTKWNMNAKETEMHFFFINMP